MRTPRSSDLDSFGSRVLYMLRTIGRETLGLADGSPHKGITDGGTGETPATMQPVQASGRACVQGTSSPTASVSQVVQSYFPRTCASVIEFIGLPGAGKTTTAEALIAELRKSGRCNVRSRQDIMTRKREADLGWLVRIARSREMFIVFCLAFLHVIMHCPVDRKHLRILKSVMLFYDLIRRLHYCRGQDIIILEHGMINYIWLINLARRGHSTWIDRLLRFVTRDKRIGYVYVRVEPRRAARRVVKRNSMATQFDHLDEKRNTCIFSSHARYFDVLLARMKECGVPIISIDGDASIEDNSRVIRQWMGALPIDGVGGAASAARRP